MSKEKVTGHGSVSVWKASDTRNINVWTTSREATFSEHRFYNELAGEYELQNPSEVVFGLGDFNGHVGEKIEGFEGVQGGNGIGQRNAEGRMLLESCDEKELWWQTRGLRRQTKER